MVEEARALRCLRGRWKRAALQADVERLQHQRLLLQCLVLLAAALS